MSSFQVLGIHPVIEKDINGQDIEIRKDARVRMFIGTKVFDADFALPELPGGVPRNEAIYTVFITKDVQAKIAELEAK